MLRIITTLLALFMAISAEAGELRVPLQGHDDLVIDLPAGWQGQVPRTSSNMPPTITITGSPSGSLEMLITPVWPNASAKALTPDELRGLVRGAADQAHTQAVERDIEISELGAPGKPGYYFSATHRQPEPGGYKYMTQGAMRLNELRVTFTVLINGDPKVPRATALALLRTLRRAPPSVDGKGGI